MIPIGVVASSIASAGVPSAPALSGYISSQGDSEYQTIHQVSWTVPANNGSAITGYVIQYLSYYNFGVWYTQGTYSAATTTATLGVDVGGDYDIRVYATNAVGNGAVSNTYGVNH
jgi:hypothetical protein